MRARIAAARPRGPSAAPARRAAAAADGWADAVVAGQAFHWFANECRAGRVRPLPASGRAPRADLESPGGRRPAADAHHGAARAAARRRAAPRRGRVARGVRAARARSSSATASSSSSSRSSTATGLRRPRRLDQLRRRGWTRHSAEELLARVAELCPRGTGLRLRVRLRRARPSVVRGGADGRRRRRWQDSASVTPADETRVGCARGRAGRARRGLFAVVMNWPLILHLGDDDPARTSATRCRRPGRWPGAATRSPTSRSHFFRLEPVLAVRRTRWPSPTR